MINRRDTRELGGYDRYERYEGARRIRVTREIRGGSYSLEMNPCSRDNCYTSVGSQQGFCFSPRPTFVDDTESHACGGVRDKKWDTVVPDLDQCHHIMKRMIRELLNYMYIIVFVMKPTYIHRAKGNECTCTSEKRVVQVVEDNEGPEVAERQGNSLSCEVCAWLGLNLRAHVRERSYGC